MELKPHSHEFDQVVMILEGRCIYHVGDDANEMGPGSVLLVPGGAEHYIEPLGTEPVMNLDIFAPARQDYLRLRDWAGKPL
jgi:quercetin dioxygenase-like cupin family protein